MDNLNNPVVTSIFNNHHHHHQFDHHAQLCNINLNLITNNNNTNNCLNSSFDNNNSNSTTPPKTPTSSSSATTLTCNFNDISTNNNNNNNNSLKSDSVTIKTSENEIYLDGILTIPEDPIGVIIFAGSSRFSPRNLYVSKVFQSAGFATLLFDLLTPQEERLDSITNEFRTNLLFLANRITDATQWILDNKDKEIGHLPIGYFGSSTVAPGAMIATLLIKHPIFALVSRGGRPTMCGSTSLKSITTPTLLLVGSQDKEVLDQNRIGFSSMSQSCKNKELIVIQNATHLFPEHGCLEQVAEYSLNFFKDQLNIFTKQNELLDLANKNHNTVNNENLIGIATQ
eukprot:gene4580-5717_t